MNGTEKNNTDELDDLKSLWHSQKEDKSYDSDEIVSMIHRKSINSVQWLFIISLLELLAGLAITLWSYFSGSHYYPQSSIELMGEENIIRLENFSNYGSLFSIVLIGIIFYYYRKISADAAVTTLIRNIINFRTVVIICLITIAAVFLAIMFPIYFDIGKGIALRNVTGRPGGAGMPAEEIETAVNAAGWTMAVISTLLIALFFFIYYFLIYGFFLRRLKRNLKELNRIKD